MISNAAKAGVIPGHWLDIDEQRLWCCEYRLDSEAFGAEWNDKECSIDVIMEKPDIEVFVGKKFLMNPGNNQEPITITITDPKGQPAEVIVHGLHVEVFPGWPDEEEEENILAIEYEAPENLQMNFFRTDFRTDLMRPLRLSCFRITSLNRTKRMIKHLIRKGMDRNEKETVYSRACIIYGLSYDSMRK